MESHDREKVSRILEAALVSLKEEASGDELLANFTPMTAIRLPSTDAQLSGAPVVILLLPNSSKPEGISTASAAQLEKPNSCACSHDGTPLHAEFERFPLSESDSRDPSKRCVIEPDRFCVGSGACEMRGY
jgi:hypothetical protein